MRARLPHRANRSRYTTFVPCIGSSCFEMRSPLITRLTELEPPTHHMTAFHVMYPRSTLHHILNDGLVLTPTLRGLMGKTRYSPRLAERMSLKRVSRPSGAPSMHSLGYISNITCGFKRLRPTIYIQALKASALKSMFRLQRLAFQNFSLGAPRFQIDPQNGF